MKLKEIWHLSSEFSTAFSFWKVLISFFFIIFLQCEKINYVLPIPVFQNILSALEKYVENPEASVEVYLSFRKAYPFGPDEEKKPSPEVNSASVR